MTFQIAPFKGCTFANSTLLGGAFCFGACRRRRGLPYRAAVCSPCICGAAPFGLLLIKASTIRETPFALCLYLVTFAPRFIFWEMRTAGAPLAFCRLAVVSFEGRPPFLYDEKGRAARFALFCSPYLVEYLQPSGARLVYLLVGKTLPKGKQKPRPCFVHIESPPRVSPQQKQRGAFRV